LGADGETVDPGFAIIRKAAHLAGPGICLQGDLRLRQHLDAMPNALNEPADGRTREQTRRPAANKDGYEGAGHIQLLDLSLQVEQERIDIGCFRKAAPKRMRVEVAIGAPPQAPRDMDVER
jgi:hypothetical protein